MRRLAGVCLVSLAMSLGVSHAAWAQDDPAACAALRNYAPPPPGTLFLYQTYEDDLEIGIGHAYEIVANSDDGTEWLRYWVQDLIPDVDTRASATSMLSRGGLFPVSIEPSGEGDGSRFYRYDDDPVDMLETLAPGETAQTERAETSSMNNRTRTIRGPLILTFEGCDAVEIDGVQESVRLYRMVSDVRSYMPGRRPQADMTMTADLIIALSDRYGWPLEFRSARHVTRVVEITAPGDQDGAGAE